MYNEDKEKEILDKWYYVIKQQGHYHEIEIIIAFRIMIKNGYNTISDMLETLKIVCTHDIYEVASSGKDTLTIHGKHYYICKP